jgi:hypothetical protein
MSNETPAFTIEEMFSVRARAHDLATADILKMIAPGLEALHDFMEFQQFEKRGAILKWDDVELVEDDSNEKILVLVGNISYPVGTEVQLEDDSWIKVTEDTAPDFQRLIRAGLPLSLADKPKEDVIAYLEKIESEEQELAQNLEAELSQLGFELKTYDDEFDLSQLTEEQRKAYEIGVKPGKA